MTRHVPVALFIISCLVSCNNAAHQQAGTNGVATDPSIQQLIDTFFQKYRDDSPASAVDFIFATNPTFSASQTETVKTKLDTTNQLIGTFNGTELITVKKTSPSFVFYSYLVKHDLQPLRFSFIFYKPSDQWQLYKFKFDDQVDAELEESGRIYFIQ